MSDIFEGYEEYEATCCEGLVPVGVSIAFGTGMASCSCGFRCAYWECACELEHDCSKEEK